MEGIRMSVPESVTARTSTVYDKSPMGMCLEHELQEELVRLIAESGMKDRERKALVLRFWKGKTYGKIGEELGVSGGRVRQLICRALRRLRHPATAKVLEAVIPFANMLPASYRGATGIQDQSGVLTKEQEKAAADIRFAMLSVRNAEPDQLDLCRHEFEKVLAQAMKSMQELPMDYGVRSYEERFVPVWSASFAVRCFMLCPQAQYVYLATDGEEWGYKFRARAYNQADFPGLKWNDDTYRWEAPFMSKGRGDLVLNTPVLLPAGFAWKDSEAHLFRRDNIMEYDNKNETWTTSPEGAQYLT
jgi:hypothetical protein